MSNQQRNIMSSMRRGIHFTIYDFNRNQKLHYLNRLKIRHKVAILRRRFDDADCKLSGNTEVKYGDKVALLRRKLGDMAS